MYDLDNLNDYEFEGLCRDIMEKVIGKELRLFARGRDGGIDATTYKGNKVIVQMKHYRKSNYNNLFSIIKKEIEKLNKNDTVDITYYICTSMDLSPDNVVQLFSLCKKYMKSTKNIVDGTEINKFLDKESNKDIVKKHYKLWLASSNVFGLITNKNVFIDCDELVNEIENDLKVYVETNSYFEAIKALKNMNVLIILGMPGVGKSTLSKMLLFYFVSKGYKVRYSSENSIKDIKKVLGGPNEKEIILLDDFLGQHYLNLNETQPNEIKTLIGYVQKNSNKKVILNSRITIYNQAKQTNYKFEQIIENNSESIYYLEIDKISYLDKAKILYNHIYFRELPDEYYHDIVRNKNYWTIIKHKYYNPRIIEFVTKPTNFKKVKASQYFEYVCYNLNNPHDIWRDEFYNRLSEVDRLLLHTLYSLGNNYTKEDVLRDAFDTRLFKESNIDTTVNQFNSVVARLSESMIKISHDKWDKLISVINPSVNDFLKYELKNNKNEREKIVKNAAYIEQVIHVYREDLCQANSDRIIRNGKIFSLKCLHKESRFYIIHSIIANDIYDKNLLDKVRDEILYVCNFDIKTISKKEYSALWEEIIESQMIVFYELDKLLCDDELIFRILNKLDGTDAERFLNKLLQYYYDTDLFFPFIRIIEDFAKERVRVNIIDEYSEYLLEFMSDEMSDALNDVKDLDYNDRIENLGMIFKNMIKDELQNDFEDLSERITYNNLLTNITFDIDDIVDGMEIQTQVEDFLNSDPYDDYDRDDDYDHHEYSGNDSESEIDRMFS